MLKFLQWMLWIMIGVLATCLTIICLAGYIYVMKDIVEICNKWYAESNWLKDIVATSILVAAVIVWTIFCGACIFAMWVFLMIIYTQPETLL